MGNNGSTQKTILEKTQKSLIRNIGLITENQQERLKNAKVAVIGAGGDGGLTIERLTRWGVGNLWILDPEGFEEENLNRQYAADFETIGMNKALAVYEAVKKINPSLEIRADPYGISPENIDDVFSWADLVIDEAEYTIPQLAILIARAGRRHGKVVITGANVGFGATIFAYHPEGKFALEQLYGVDREMPIEDICGKADPVKGLCPWIPKYGLQLFERVHRSEIAAPMVSSSVALVAAIVSNETIRFLTETGDLVYLPRYIWAELNYRRMKVRKFSNSSFAVSYLIARFYRALGMGDAKHYS